MKTQINMINNENYSKYGKVLEFPTNNPVFSLDYVDFWNNALEYQIDGPTDIGICVVNKKRDGVVPELERHFNSVEVTVPLDGSMIIAVAPAVKENDPDEIPSAENIELFFVRQKQTFTMNPGVWHTAPFAVDGNHVSMLVFLKHDTFHKDGQFKKLDPPFKFELNL